MKKKPETKPEAGLRMLTRGWPIWIRDGKLDRPELQVALFMSEMFDHIEHGEIPLQANMEIKILTRRL